MTIVRHFAMSSRTFLLLALLVSAAAPASADARSDARKQVDFGIAVAQKGLWREAIYRWERAKIGRAHV